MKILKTDFMIKSYYFLCQNLGPMEPHLLLIAEGKRAPTGTRAVPPMGTPDFGPQTPVEQPFCSYKASRHKPQPPDCAMAGAGAGAGVG